MVMNKSLRNALIVISLAIPTITMADQAYQVELIIFSHPLSKGVSQEQWPQDAITLPNLDNTITLNSITTNNEPNPEMNDSRNPNSNKPELLPASQWKLISEEQHLRRHPDYHILLHQAWSQTIPSNAKQPTRIHLYGGQGYQHNGKVIPIDITETAAQFDQANTWQMNGVMSLYLNRYVNAQFNLAFAMPTSQFEALNHNPKSAKPSHQAFTYLMLNQKRRTKSNELNYIDHPVYGILMKVIPIKKTT